MGGGGFNGPWSRVRSRDFVTRMEQSGPVRVRKRAQRQNGQRAADRFDPRNLVQGWAYAVEVPGHPVSSEVERSDEFLSSFRVAFRSISACWRTSLATVSMPFIRAEVP